MPFGRRKCDECEDPLSLLRGDSSTIWLKKIEKWKGVKLRIEPENSQFRYSK